MPICAAAWPVSCHVLRMCSYAAVWRGIYAATTAADAKWPEECYSAIRVHDEAVEMAPKGLLTKIEAKIQASRVRSSDLRRGHRSDAAHVEPDAISQARIRCRRVKEPMCGT